MPCSTGRGGSCHRTPPAVAAPTDAPVCRPPTASCSPYTCASHTISTAVPACRSSTVVVTNSNHGGGPTGCFGRRRGNRKPLKTSRVCHPGTATYLLGLATSATGFLLGVGALRISSTTDSTQYLEKPLPILAGASVMALTGLAVLLASRQKYRLMIIISIALSFVSSLFCFASFIYLVTDVNVNLRRLSDCTFQRTNNVCQCLVSNANGRRVFRFTAVDSCAAVQDNLRELVYGVCVLFGVGFVISCATMVISCYLLYAEYRKNHATQRVRSSGDGCNDLTSITTQTLETSFRTSTTTTVVRRDSESVDAPMLAMGDDVRHESSRTTANASVATQTPMYMMPVAQLVYEMNSSVNDYRPVNLLLGDRDEPPPPYTDTFI